MSAEQLTQSPEPPIETRTLDVNASLRLLAQHLVGPEVNAGNLALIDDMAGLEAKLEATNSYLPMSPNVLARILIEYDSNHFPRHIYENDRPCVRKVLSPEESVAFYLHHAMSRHHLDIMFRAMAHFDIGFPEPIPELIERTTFVHESDTSYANRSPQSVVLNKKVIGRIINTRAIPGSEQYLAQVDAGDTDNYGKPILRQIMYGGMGDNDEGLLPDSFVVVALPNARIRRPDGNVRKLRARSWNNFSGGPVWSHGMLCSHRETCDKPLTFRALYGDEHRVLRLDDTAFVPRTDDLAPCRASESFDVSTLRPGTPIDTVYETWSQATRQFMTVEMSGGTVLRQVLQTDWREACRSAGVTPPKIA